MYTYTPTPTHTHFLGIESKSVCASAECGVWCVVGMVSVCAPAPEGIRIACRAEDEELCQARCLVRVSSITESCSLCWHLLANSRCEYVCSAAAAATSSFSEWLVINSPGQVKAAPPH